MRKEIHNKITEKNEHENIEKQKEKNTNMILAAFIMFIFPIISIFLGVFLGGFIAQSFETSLMMYQIIGGIVGFMLACIAIKLFDRSSKVDENAEKIDWDDL